MDGPHVTEARVGLVNRRVVEVVGRPPGSVDVSLREVTLSDVVGGITGS